MVINYKKGNEQNPIFNLGKKPENEISFSSYFGKKSDFKNKIVIYQPEALSNKVKVWDGDHVKLSKKPINSTIDHKYFMINTNLGHFALETIEDISAKSKNFNDFYNKCKNEFKKQGVSEINQGKLLLDGQEANNMMFLYIK